MTARNPPLYLLSTIKIRPGRMQDFCKLMPRVIAIVEEHGWRLVGAWTHLGGRLNMVIDLWQIADANALPSGLGVLMTALEWPDIALALAECVEDEFIQMMSALPFDTGRIADHLP